MGVAEPFVVAEPRQGGPRTPSHWRAEIGLASICLVWGATFVVVKSALADVSTLLFLGLRFTLATLVLLVIFLFRRGIGAAFRRGPLLGGILAGCCLFSGYFLQTAGLKYTTPGKCGFITGLYIVLVPLLSSIVHRKVPDKFEWLGVSLATVGMGLMAIDGESLRINVGDALTAGCAVMYAVHILVLGRFSPTMSVERLDAAAIGHVRRARFSRQSAAREGLFPANPVRLDGDRGDRGPGHGAGLHHSDLGPKVHHPDPDCGDLLSGTGFRPGYILCCRSRERDGALDFRSRLHFGGHPGRGTETR